MLSAPIVRMGRTEDVGVRIGMCFTIMAISAVAGPPISGAINAATGGFKFTGIYAGTHYGALLVCSNADLLMIATLIGAAVMLAVVFLMLTRISLLGGMWGRC